MQIKYKPPQNIKEECEFLENNFMTCLTEKS